MNKPDFVQFQQSSTDTANSQSQTIICFDEIHEVNQVDQFNKRKSHGMKKNKNLHSVSKTSWTKKLVTVISFPVSISLLNLLRDPKIENHQFDENYLKSIYENLSFIVKQKQTVKRSYVLYLHLILSQIINFQQLQEELFFKSQVVPFNSEIWNSTNVMNTYCLLTNIQSLQATSQEQQGKGQIELAEFKIDIVEQEKICIIVQNQLKVSSNFFDIALRSHGHWDIYFAPFLLEKLQTQVSYRYLTCEQTENTLLSNYSEIFIQLCNQFATNTKAFTENWYQNQLQKLINDQLPINQIEQLVYSGIKNEGLQKFLIGLLGWKDNTQKAIKLLNIYYDSNDWQNNDAIKPTICQCGQNFTINYLIENSKYRDKLVMCLKAPCFNSKYNHYFFSFHKPRLNQYNADDESYLWIQNPFGEFKKSGYYDWILYFANPQGKETVSKIIDIRENQKAGSQVFNRKFLNMKNVKGRYIIHPKKSRQMQIHQIFIDSLCSDEGLFKSPTFSDVLKEAQILKKSGVNSIYLSGVFERDNGEFQYGFKRPQASSVAVTNRALPSSMLGGQKQFKKLCQYFKQNNLKLIVDCYSRVSSSRMSKKYESLKLMCIDQKGRKNFFYGSEGKAMSYEETAILNYRKKQSWDLLLQQIIELIEKYQIDGINLQNGHVCPQIYQIDKEEFNRVENGKSIYTHEQIFEGRVINPKKKSGYWAVKDVQYPNPFFVFLTQKIWNKYPNFTFICETYETQNSVKFVNAIQSGFIPRLFKLPKALSHIVGVHLHQNGSISQTPKKSLTKLVKWYQEMKKMLPKNSILIQSTTNQIYPYPSFVFKRATWAFIDLFFFLPQVPMTFSKQYLGKSYRTKALNMFVENETQGDLNLKPDARQTNQINFLKKTSYSVVNSAFFEQENQIKKKEAVSTFSNSTLRDPSQIKYLQESFRKQIGPQFGFDLGEISKHYKHRREIREQQPLLCTYRMISLSALHLYGVHTNVISFAKYNDKQILLVSINFNDGPIDMHYNLTTLKGLFTCPADSDLIIKIQDVLNPIKFVEEYYTVGQLLNSKIQQSIKPFASSMWRLTILSYSEKLMKKAFQCSQKRIAQRISRNPPQWIHSSIFTNELSRLIDDSKTFIPFVKGLNKLYNEFILPMNLNLNLVISKTYDFYVHKAKLQKLFGILKLLQRYQNRQYFENFAPALRSHLQNLLKGNQLGPIAFVTPQIGNWSSVGGLGVMVDQLSKELVRLKQTVYIITPYYQYNKKKETGYLARDGFHYDRNIKVYQAHFQQQFGIHRGVYEGVNYIWFHNPELFSRPYDGEGPIFVTKQLVFFALITLEAFCQLQIFPSLIVTNDWMCGFVSAYVKVHKFKQVFNGTKFMHICHNLAPDYEGRLYPKYEDGDLNWLIQLPREWYFQCINNKMIINPSKCALQTCDNWGTVSHSYKIDLLKQSPLADVLWKHQNAFSFPNGVRKDERLSIIHSKTPGDHYQCKKALQQKYFGLENLNDEVPLFAFIGRVTKQKGVHLIIDAVQSLLFQNQHKIQFIIGGPSDSRQEYGKYCAERMKSLTQKYPQCVWSNPEAFFTDGALVNVGSDFSMMPSLFQPGGIVQHQFFCGSTPVIAFRTGGLKDTVFDYDIKTKKGNGFNFMSYDVEDFKKCMRRAINCFKNKEAYQKLRQNAFESVIQVADVARGWNNEFYRMQNKIYIDWNRVEEEIQTFTQRKDESKKEIEVQVLKLEKGEFWRKDWEIKRGFKEVLKGASRLQVKTHLFCYETDKIPRPKEVMITGNWNDWKHPAKMNFQKIHKNWKVTLKLKPGTYYYKYIVDGQWCLAKQQQVDIDENNNQNHVVVIE